jgi:hypothetical protein
MADFVMFRVTCRKYVGGIVCADSEGLGAIIQGLRKNGRKRLVGRPCGGVSQPNQHCAIQYSNAGGSCRNKYGGWPMSTLVQEVWWA